MIHKHKRKYFKHIQIFKKLKVKEESYDTYIEVVKQAFIDSKCEFLMAKVWVEVIEESKSLEDLIKIVMAKTDDGELLRQTSFLGRLLKQSERDEIWSRWLMFEKRWMEK